MTGIGLLPVFVVGLLGSVHCAGMCGGIVGALSLAPGRPVPVMVTVGAAVRPALANTLAYNLGRIGSYMLAGALAGGIGAGAVSLARLPALQAGGYWMANLMLAMLGLYLMDAWRGLARLEQGGQLLWRRVQPMLRRLQPGQGVRFGPGRMLAAGALWGWLPCGMVYSVLVTAMLSGSAAGGALTMLAFGLGTLPMLLGLGLLGARLRAGLRVRGVRLACGALVLGFGLLGLVRAAGGLPHSWLETICVTPGAAA
ncbi:cytochrome biogenesis protein [Massilia sp. WF1]|uniref:sulfite exporter TauE/SafE family protein n=1 Tax=unclassified Massilia TaxID=2609279 RepID=UPI00068DC8D0|nr:MULTISPECIES: sulfite exporter TauE/SafE family protein [unclassified Massilia]ALK97891.1 cytochrome biogenesis protein [Massilia sp. WG5]KNZ67687.1 cytochrome biogenesis protein [Massilia sp. WF1]